MRAHFVIAAVNKSFACRCCGTTGILKVTKLLWRIHANSLFLELRTDVSGPICFHEKLVRNYHYALRNTPEERSSRPFRDGSLK
jgi:hypothetical protein